MLRKFSTVATLMTAAAALSACGGGGGGGGGGGVGGGVVTPPVPYNGTSGGNFTSWSAVGASSTTTATGLSREVTYTRTNAGYTSQNLSGSLNANYSQTVNGAGDPTAVAVGNTNRSVSFNVSNGDSIVAGAVGTLDVIYASSGSLPRYSIAIDPEAKGWNYQSFGVWDDYTISNNTITGASGVASVGKTTNGDQIPASGTATFTGVIAGLYVNANSIEDLVSAPLTVGVDFASRSASLTSGNLVGNVVGTNLNTTITGTLTYSSQSNALTGNLSAFGGRLTGGANAQFYGPAAQEIGGVFGLTGPGTERMIGGFGAKR